MWLWEKQQVKLESAAEEVHKTGVFPFQNGCNATFAAVWHVKTSIWRILLKLDVSWCIWHLNLSDNAHPGCAAYASGLREFGIECGIFNCRPKMCVWCRHENLPVQPCRQLYGSRGSLPAWDLPRLSCRKLPQLQLVIFRNWRKSGW